MRRDPLRDMFIAWTIGLLSLAVLTAFLMGCGFHYEITGPSGDVESALLAYTAQYAATLHVRVEGVIATNRAAGQAEEGVSGWYEAGKAYYYRPDVAQYITLVDGQCPAAPRCELAGGVAAHEVCHALWPGHDMRHWCCMVTLGVRPTYEPPVKVEGQWPIC